GCLQRKVVAHFANDDCPPRGPAQIHHQEIHSHRGPAKRGRDDVLNGGVNQAVIHIEQSVSKREQRQGKGERAVTLANSDIGQRSSQQRRYGCNFHPSTSALRHAISHVTCCPSSHHATHGINNAHGSSGPRHIHVVNASEQRREK